MNEGQKQKTGSLSLQVNRKFVPTDNSYTKIIVLIHIINSLQAPSTCLSMSTKISWHIGRQRYCKADPANATALWSVFYTAQFMVPPLQAEKRLTCGMLNGT